MLYGSLCLGWDSEFYEFALPGDMLACGLYRQDTDRDMRDIPVIPVCLRGSGGIIQPIEIGL